jgi:hypothetical protein
MKFMVRHTFQFTRYLEFITRLCPVPEPLILLFRRQKDYIHSQQPRRR